MKHLGLILIVLGVIALLQTSTAAACLNVTDGRLNNSTALDCGAPVVVFLTEPDENGFAYLEILGAGNGQVTQAMRIPSIFWEIAPPAREHTLIDFAGNPNNGQPIGAYLMLDGTVVIETAYADAKPYVIRFDPDGQPRITHIAW